MVWIETDNQKIEHDEDDESVVFPSPTGFEVSVTCPRYKDQVRKRKFVAHIGKWEERPCLFIGTRGGVNDYIDESWEGSDDEKDFDELRDSLQYGMYTDVVYDIFFNVLK